MEMSDKIDQLAAALAVAQATIGTAVKDSTNPHFRSSYADLLSVWRAANPVLAANDLSVSQLCEPSTDGATVSVTTILMHKSGQWMRGTLTMRPVKADPQGIGSAITYARRYALAAAVGVCPEDDDGNAASSQAPPAADKPKPTKKPGPREQLLAAVKAWTGVADEDMPGMMASVKRASGVTNEKASEADIKTMLAFVEANKGTMFAEVLE